MSVLGWVIVSGGMQGPRMKIAKFLPGAAPGITRMQLTDGEYQNSIGVSGIDREWREGDVLTLLHASDAAAAGGVGPLVAVSINDDPRILCEMSDASRYCTCGCGEVYHIRPRIIEQQQATEADITC